MESILQEISRNEEGYLLPISPILSKDDATPLILLCAEELWLKFHPHYTRFGVNNSTTLKRERKDDEKLDNLKNNYKNDSNKDRVRKMVHFPSMYNRIVSVLNSIEKMRDGHGSAKSAATEPSILNNPEDLGKGDINDSEGEDEKDGDEEDVKDGEGEDEKDGEENLHNDKSTSIMRIVKTWNSIRLLFPILFGMLNHESKDDSEFLTKKSITKMKLKSEKQWMLGEYVYDASSKKSLESLRRQMKMMLMAFLTSKETHNLLAKNADWKFIDPLKRLESPLGYIETFENPLKILNLNLKQFEVAKEIDVTLKSHFSRIHKQKEAFSRSVIKVKSELESVLVSRFPGCKLQVYGSCLSDLSIGESSDVDISIYIPSLHRAKNRLFRNKIDSIAYQKIVKRFVYALYGRLCIKSDSFFNLQPVTRARVPVVKGCYRLAGNPLSKDGSLNFDICFSNEIAVRNSELLLNYSNVCFQSKALMVLVKKWAKDNKVSSAADEKLSSYAWTILVIYYLQKIGLLPNLQCPELINTINQKDNHDNIDGLNTKFVSWDNLKNAGLWLPKENASNIPLIILFHGFFHFLTNCYPYGLVALSIRNASIIPKTYFRNVSISFISIEDPFETFESKRPHDLASPVSQKGAEEILSYLALAEEELRLLLLGKSRTCQDNNNNEDTGIGLENEIMQAPAIESNTFHDKDAISRKNKGKARKMKNDTSTTKLITLLKDMAIAKNMSCPSLPPKNQDTVSVQSESHVIQETSTSNDNTMSCASHASLPQPNKNQQSTISITTETQSKKKGNQEIPKDAAAAPNSVKTHQKRKTKKNKAKIGQGIRFDKKSIPNKMILQNSSFHVVSEENFLEKDTSNKKGTVCDDNQEVVLAGRNQSDEPHGAPPPVPSPNSEKESIN
jgi:DNA polymerase sigma